MHSVVKPLLSLNFSEEIRRRIRKEKGYFRISGCSVSQSTHLLASFRDEFKYSVIVCEDEVLARLVEEELSFLRDDVFFYPHRDLLFY